MSILLYVVSVVVGVSVFIGLVWGVYRAHGLRFDSPDSVRLLDTRMGQFTLWVALLIGGLLLSIGFYAASTWPDPAFGFHTHPLEVLLVATVGWLLSRFYSWLDVNRTT